MTVLGVVLLVVLGGLLLVFSSWATLVGLVAVITSERIERCPRCGRHGITAGGARHPKGCPPGVTERLVGVWERRPNDLHLRHH